jgi:DNA-binding winged helix-turn-helix (wHTH) protein/Tol biopolymer transport system component
MEGFGSNSFRLGEYLILPQHNKLILGDNEHKIEPKIMQVLCYLILHKKEVISREIIAKEIWPNSVIGLEVVTRAIFELRKILKDDPKKPVYIETIARKGYCFIYETSPFDEQNPNNKLSLKSKVGKSKKRFIMILGMMVGLVLFFMYQWFLNISDASSSSPLKVKLLTDIGIYSSSPAMSPKGSQVLFIRKKHFQEAKNQLVLLDLNTHKQTVINEGSEYKNPKWSKNDNYWLYLKCKTKSTCEVIKHEINSTKKKSLYQVKYPLFNFALSDNNKLLFLEVLVDNRKQLAQVNLDQANNETHFIETPVESHSLPTFSHDNKKLYYVSTVRGGTSHLFQYDIISQNSTLINDQFSRLRGISVKDDKTLWLAGRLKGQVGIWSLNTENHKISFEFKSLPGHIPSQTTSHVKASNLIYENTTKTINLESAGDFTLPNLSNANSSMIDMNAVYAPKTKVLYFSSNRSGSYELWRLKQDEVEKVTNIQADMIERPIINVQEDKLAFITRAKVNTEMTIFDLTNKTELIKIILPKKVFLLSWSNDQNFIYFSAFENKKYNIYKLNIQTSKTERFILNAGAIAQESQDGNYLYYGDMLNGQLMRRTLLGEVDVMFKIPPSDLRGIIPHRLKIIHDSFYYISVEGGKSLLKYYSFTDRTLQVHIELPKDIYVTDIVNNKSVGVIFDRLIKVNSNLIELH